MADYTWISNTVGAWSDKNNWVVGDKPADFYPGQSDASDTATIVDGQKPSIVTADVDVGLASLTLGNTENSGATITGDGNRIITTRQLLLYNGFVVASVTFDVGERLFIRSGVGSKFEKGKLISRAIGTWDKGSNYSIVACGGFVFQNDGTFDIQCDLLLGNRQNCDKEAPPELVNNGTITKSVSSSPKLSTDIWLVLRNAGTIDIEAGKLRLAIPASTIAPMPGVSTGKFTGSPGTTLMVNGPNQFGKTSTFSVDEIDFNDWGWNNGDVLIEGSFAANTTTVVTRQLKITGLIKSLGTVYMRDADATLIITGPQHFPTK